MKINRKLHLETICKHTLHRIHKDLIPETKYSTEGGGKCARCKRRNREILLSLEAQMRKQVNILCFFIHKVFTFCRCVRSDVVFCEIQFFSRAGPHASWRPFLSLLNFSDTFKARALPCAEPQCKLLPGPPRCRPKPQAGWLRLRWSEGAEGSAETNLIKTPAHLCGARLTETD